MSLSMQDKVKQDLEKKGVLPKIRKLFNEKIHSILKSQLPESTKKHPELETNSGQISCALVQDFLQSFGLKLTSSLFIPESQQEINREIIETLENALERKSEPRRPLLFDVLEKYFDHGEGDDEDVDDEDVETSIQEELDLQGSMDSMRDHIAESGNSQGYDQSANSLAMNEFDYVENVRRVKK